MEHVTPWPGGRVLAAGAVLVAAAAITWLIPGSPAHRAVVGRASPLPASPPAAAPVACGPASPDARLAAALAPVLRGHPGSLAAAIADSSAGLTATYHAAQAFDTASIVKADILAVLLIQHQQSGTPLSRDERALAAEMIEDSDNDAATGLWNAVGGTMGMEAGNAALALHGIAPGAGGYWGLTRTTAAGQLGLLADLTSARSPLRASARGYALNLMRHVQPAQAWGVTAAASPHTRPVVKNGWLPTGPAGSWVINSIGVIRHGRAQLLIAVLSDGQPSEAAGIAHLQSAARAAVTAAQCPHR